MSAIAGILWFDQSRAQDGYVEKLTEAMRSAGPDAQSCWCLGPVALGHCMLRTTPESLQERQPVASTDALTVLVWDGRLDNREELQQALATDGRFSRDASDAELVLQCHAMWGEGCVTHLLGDFAFAIWDQKQKKLFCARDAMGARPFFFTRTGDFLAFASSDDALAALPGVSLALSEKHVAYYLVPTYLGFDCTHSWLREIKALAAGECMTVAADGVEHKRIYWELAPGPEASFASDAECIRAFLKVFTEAVRCRLRSAGDVAAMVSGGLDSASVVATARSLLPARSSTALHAYSAISDTARNCVETRCIQSMTAGMGERAHHVSAPSMTGMLTASDLAQVAWEGAHPIDNSMLVPALMCLAAGRAGHRVVLTGVCGDLTTHGAYPYIPALMRAGRWRKAWSECRGAAQHHTYWQGTRPALLFLRSLYHLTAPVTLKRFARRVRGFLRGSHAKGSLINAEFSRRVGVEEWHRAQDRALGPFLTDIQQAHILTLRPPHGLASSMGGFNRLAGKFGVEVRDPWADRRVVEFWLRLPLDYKYRHGWTKYLVRAAMEPSIPAEVAWRVGKEHVGWNLYSRLMEETKDWIRGILDEGLESIDHFVDRAAVGREHAAWEATRGHEQRERIFNLVTLISWLRRYSHSY